MKAQYNPKFLESDFPPQAGFSKRFVSNFVQMAGQLYQSVNGGLALADNMNGAKLTLPLAHGVPYLLASPLHSKQIPIGIQPLGCDTQPTPQVSMTTSATVNGTLTAAPSGYVFVTALYPLVEQFLYVSSTGTQSISTGTVTKVNFQETVKSIGSNIGYDGVGTITLKAAGNYLIAYSFTWNTGSAIGSRFGCVSANGTSQRWAATECPGSVSSDNVSNSGSCIYPAAVGDSLSVIGFQTIGANLLILSNLPGQGFQIRQLSNDASLTANVTLFAWGG